MSHRDVVNKAWDQNLLYSVLIELTYRCNLDCFFCYNDVGQKGTPLSLEQYQAFLRDLADLQVMELTLSGGEPLANPDFFGIGATARELGFVVRVKSNGHALGGRLAQRIKDEVDPFVIDVSLHGATPETHDRQTRIPGSFDKLIANLEEMKSIGLRLKLNATLTRWNEHEIEEMAAIGRSLELALAMFPTVTPRDDGDNEPLSIAPSSDAVRRLYEFRYRDAPIQDDAATAASDDATTESDKNCGAGSSGVAVDPFGEVYPCVQWRRSIGNLHERSIKQIWAGSDDLEEIRALTIQAKQRKQALGAVGAQMNFCLGLSEEKVGDPLAIDPGARREAEILDEFLTERKRSVLPVVR